MEKDVQDSRNALVATKTKAVNRNPEIKTRNKNIINRKKRPIPEAKVYTTSASGASSECGFRDVMFTPAVLATALPTRREEIIKRQKNAKVIKCARPSPGTSALHSAKIH